MTTFTRFPVYPSHTTARCFNCARVPLDGDLREEYAAGEGRFSQACTTCQVRTWYDVAELAGTLDDLEPQLRLLGFVALRMMSGPVNLAVADPYGARRLGSVNIQSGRWAEHVWRARYIEFGGVPYLTDAQEATAPFVNGLFRLLREGER